MLCMYSSRVCCHGRAQTPVISGVWWPMRDRGVCLHILYSFDRLLSSSFEIESRRSSRRAARTSRLGRAPARCRCYNRKNLIADARRTIETGCVWIRMVLRIDHSIRLCNPCGPRPIPYTKGRTLGAYARVNRRAVNRSGNLACGERLRHVRARGELSTHPGPLRAVRSACSAPMCRLLSSSHLQSTCRRSATRSGGSSPLLGRLEAPLLALRQWGWWLHLQPQLWLWP